MIKTIALFEVNQPIGCFYIGKINSNDLIKIANIIPRRNNVGTQREIAEKRVYEIAKYCEDPDATFPTPIVLSICSEDVEIEKGENDVFEMKYSVDKKYAEILDGQHRVEGIKKANNFDTELIVAIMFDLTGEEKAYVFSTINSNQKKVDKSLIYDLFEVSSDRSPYKTCHEIARVMNSNPESPFFKRLKMLGKKSNQMALLSQGTFVTYLSKLITNTPQEDMINIKNGKKLKENDKYIFRKFFSQERDDVILKILLNYFGAASEVFELEWNDKEFILSKTTGYGALLKALNTYYLIGEEEGDLSKEFFIDKMKRAKKYLNDQGIELTSEYIHSGEQGQNYLASLLKQSVNG